MPSVKLLGQVDESHRLVADVPNFIRPGPVEIIVLVSSSEEDDTGAAWMQGVAREWQDELNDPREDIYTLADGEPVHGSR